MKFLRQPIHQLRFHSTDELLKFFAERFVTIGTAGPPFMQAPLA
jgi:hypothetical protein